MTTPATPTQSGADAERLRARIAELEADRRRLVIAVELLRELAGLFDYRDIVHAVARRVGYALELDRCSVFLTERGGAVHLVASYEDPALPSRPVDLDRYPELRRALAGEVAHIPDVALDPELERVQDVLAARRVRAILAVPIAWRRAPIGALFLRTDRTKPALGPGDIQWARLIADVTARSLQTAHRFERQEARRRGGSDQLARDRDRAALLAFIERLLAAYGERAGPSEDLVARTTRAEIERLAGVALSVLAKDGRA